MPHKHTQAISDTLTQYADRTETARIAAWEVAEAVDIASARGMFKRKQRFDIRTKNGKLVSLNALTAVADGGDPGKVEWMKCNVHEM